MGFPREELEHRQERARVLMHAARLDALVVSSPPNWRYFTDLDLMLSVTPSRPVFFVLPLAGDPVVVVPALFAPEVAELPYRHHLEAWPSPRPHDEGVALLAQVLSALPGRFGLVGFELGTEMRLGMPTLDYLQLRQGCSACSFVDASPLLWTLRSVKSPAELERIARAARLTGEALRPGHLTDAVGQTETEVARAFKVRALRAGLDEVGYLALGSGPGGYGSITRPAGKRVLQGATC